MVPNCQSWKVEAPAIAGERQEEDDFAGVENRRNAMHKLVGWETNLQGCGASRLVSQELDGEFGRQCS